MTPVDPVWVRSISEAQFQAEILSRAESLGWKHYHPPDNRPITARSGRRYVQNVRKGFPDLVLVKGDHLIFAELKKQTGTVSPEQKEWIAALRATGAWVEVWRPSDLNTIVALLRDPDTETAARRTAP